VKKLRLYVDITHPACAHALRFFILGMKERGHQVLVSARDKDVSHCLLRAWGIDFISRGKGSVPAAGNKKGSMARWQAAADLGGKVADLIRVTARLLPVIKKFSPDAVISYSSYHAAFIGRLLGKPVITFEDTEAVPILHTVNRLMSTYMVTPACFERDMGRKHLRFSGYKELASLHPDRFTPVPLPDGIKKPFILIRFVSWMAYHDRGHSGISDAMKHKVVERLSASGNVFISSERPLAPWMERFRVPVNCEMGHSLLAGASLLFGESASMAAEAAVLGVPAIFIDNTGRGYTRELEREHRLMFNFRDDDESVLAALDKAAGMLGDPGLPGEWQKKRNRMLSGKGDLTSWMTELVEKVAYGG
jgi:uncharacterized protein